MFKKILIVILVILLVGIISSFIFIKDKDIITTQTISRTGYQLSLKHDGTLLINQGEEEYLPGYAYNGGIVLDHDDNYENGNLSFDYTIEDNGDDTPSPISDTGAPPFPPQADELVYPLTDDYEKVGEWLGYNLYIEKEIKDWGYVYQEVFPGQITEQMTLLSKNKERVNYYDRLLITYQFDPQQDLEQQRSEFLNILKSMKIEEM